MASGLKGGLMLLITALIWGTAFVAQSEGMDYTEPFTYNAMRTLLGGFALIPVIFILNGTKMYGKAERKISYRNTLRGGMVCGVLLFIASSFQQSGIAQTTTGKAGFITALYIIIVPVLGTVTGKRIPVRMWLFAAMAVAGFYLLCIRDGFSVSRGDILVLVCAFFFACHIIAVEYFNRNDTDPVMMSCVQFFTAGIIMLVCMFIFETPSIENIYRARYTILYAGIMSSGVAYTLQIVGQKYTSPTAATLIMSLESVFAALSGWLILKEKLCAREICGCTVVFAAVICAQIFNSSEE